MTSAPRPCRAAPPSPADRDRTATRLLSDNEQNLIRLGEQNFAGGMEAQSKTLGGILNRGLVASDAPLALGGLLIAWLGVGTAYIVDACSFVAVIVTFS